MKNILYKIIKGVILLGIALSIGLLLSQKKLPFYVIGIPAYSKYYLYFGFFYAIICYIPFAFLDNYCLFLHKKKKFLSYIASTIILLTIIVFSFFIITKDANINWATVNDANWFNNFLYFMEYIKFLPYPPFEYWAFIPYTFLFTIYEYFIHNTKDVLLKTDFDYVNEVIFKKVCKHSFFLTFTIFMLFSPNLYYYIRRLQYILLVILIFYIAISIIKIIVSLNAIKRVNQQNVHNKNLFVVVTLENCCFNLCSSNLSEFNKFNKLSNNIFNNLIIENKGFNIVSYNAIRHSLIDINSYQKVYYIFLLQNTSLMFLSKNGKDALFSKIEEVDKSGYKFKIISPHGFTKTAKELEKKYKSQYKNRLDISTIFKEIIEDEENIELSRKASELLKDVNDRKPNRYIKYALKQIINSHNPLENFYTILKIAEYVIHYRALRNIVDKEDISSSPDSLKRNLSNPTLGVWINYQKLKEEKRVKKYDSPEIVKAFNHIDDIFKMPRKFEGKSVVNYKDICDYIVNVRNNILVHGILTYEVSVNLVNDLFILTENIVRPFLELNISISEHDLIQGLFTENIRALEDEEEEFYLYSFGIERANKDLLLEYLNYKNGNLMVKAKDNKIKIDENKLRGVK